MGRERVAVAAGIVIALVAGAGLPSVSSADFQFEAAGTPTGWEAVLNYEIDANWTNVTDYWVDGDFSDVIVCNVDWVLVTEETTSTDRDNLKQYALDYDEGEFGFLKVKSGTQTKEIAVCSSFSLESTSASEGDWDKTVPDCRAGGADGEDQAETDPWLPLNGPIDAFVDDEQAGHCLWAFAADTTGDYIPYTGIVKAELVDYGEDPSEIRNKVTMSSVGGYHYLTDRDHPEDDDQACSLNCKVEGFTGEFLEGVGFPSSGHLKARAET